MENSYKNDPEYSPHGEGFFPDHCLYLETNTPFSRPEAFVGILVAAACTKGCLSSDQIIDLFTFLLQTKTLRKFSKKEVEHMMGKMFTHLKEKGFDSLFEHATYFYRKAPQKTMYKNACAVVFFVKMEDSAKDQFLEDLQIATGLSPLKTKQIRQKMELKAFARGFKNTFLIEELS